MSQENNRKEEIEKYRQFFKPIKNKVLTELAIHIPSFEWDDLYEAIYDNESLRFDQYVSGFARCFTYLTKPIFTRMMDNSNTLKLRFFGFSIFLAFYRRRKAYSKMRNFFNKHENEFRAIQKMKFVKGVVLKHSNTPFEIAQAVAILDTVIEEFQKADNPGYLQSYADAVIIAVDRDLKPPSFTKEEHLQRAEERITQALDLNPEYPKYYATLAQLEFHGGKYESALQNIREAMQLEDPSSADHPIRLLDYRSLQVKAETYRDFAHIKSNADSVKEEIEKVREDVKQERGRSVGFIGVFSALIALVIATTSMITVDKFGNSVLLLVILGGLLLIIVETMMVRLSSNEKKWEPCLFVTAGIVLIVLAFIVKIVFVSLGIE